MTSDPFERMQEALEKANEDDTVLLSIISEDVDMKIHEGSEYPQINHENFLPFYLKYLKGQHGLDPQKVTQRAIRDIEERIE